MYVRRRDQTDTSVPSRPSRRNFCIVWMLPLKLTEKPTIDLTPAIRTASAISWAWSRFRPIGFSQRTCLPAPAQARAWSRWRKFGEEMTTASTSPRKSS